MVRAALIAGLVVLALPAPASGAIQRVIVRDLPATVTGQTPFEAKLRVQRRGRSPNTVVVRLWLSRDDDLDRRKDVRLKGRARIRFPDRRRRGPRATLSQLGSGVGTFSVPASTASRAYFVLACAATRCGTSKKRLRFKKAQGPSQPQQPDPLPTGSGWTVRYTVRGCYAKGIGAVATVPYATVRVTRPPDAAVDIPLDGAGQFTKAPPVDGQNPWQATLVLTGDHVEVAPWTPAGAAPYAIPLGPVTAAGQTFTVGGGDGSPTPDAPSGAVNIFVTLERAARVAEPLVSASLPKLRAL